MVLPAHREYFTHDWEWVTALTYDDGERPDGRSSWIRYENLRMDKAAAACEKLQKLDTALRLLKDKNTVMPKNGTRINSMVQRSYKRLDDIRNVSYSAH